MKQLTSENIWKIERDNCYYPLVLKYGFDYIQKAGFFFDENVYNVNLEESLKILCTPISHLKDKVITDKKSIVLVGSGSLCPCHDGHIEMMLLAKVKMEDLDFNVLGGYISPDHEKYVSRKNGNEYIHTIERIKLTSEKIWELGYESWLSVDPWYGLFNHCDVNFTDLCARTKMYVEKYLNTKISICYVCGSDNGDFSLAFENTNDCCIVVNRPNLETKYLAKLPNVFVLDSTINLSSTEIRKTYLHSNSIKKDLKLRLDNSHSIPIDIFKKYFNNVEVIDYKEQIEKFNKLNANVISLDPLIRCKNYIQTSRIYDIFGHQKVGHYISNDYDIDKTKKYQLYDDDIYTGETMRTVSGYLKEKDINIESYISFNITNNKETEVLDNRDFIIFSENNGLVSCINNIRIPYVYPFVDPLLRCSIINPLEFSIDIWRFNLELNSGVKIKLYDTKQFELFSMLGFDGDTLAKDICKYYLNFLETL